ncbi:uncharacterized protein LOC132882886 isoform X2 [Neoarius graeffei]|uniref:uncharacterized protein LOC132882886 isoform X2 n=1 Tax=Neoarius graeffei TaxID=443677 RepID=UPI00298C9F73|nr:uncharacterized protein LOC132882886 isoform X2 [Neoarius graeffei]
MFSRSLLLVLLVLVCLQSFTSAQDADGPDQCCFDYYKSPIPANIITAYNVTDLQCKNPVVIFTLNNSIEACAHPEDEWVKSIMELIDQRQGRIYQKGIGAIEPTKCCFSYYKKRIPANIITAYQETHIKCINPAVIFTLNNGIEACADPKDEWVKNNMKQIDQRMFTTTDTVNTQLKITLLSRTAKRRVQILKTSGCRTT